MVGWLMPCFLIGGIVAQWHTLGRASDFTDRRRVLLFAAILGGGWCVYSCVFWLGQSVALRRWRYLFRVRGGMSVYSVALAHANDRSARSESVEMSGGMPFTLWHWCDFGSDIDSVFGGFGRAWFIYICCACLCSVDGLYHLAYDATRAHGGSNQRLQPTILYNMALRWRILICVFWLRSTSQRKKFRARRKKHKAHKPVTEATPAVEPPKQDSHS